MDHQNIILFGCLTLALAISAFILWGPSPRPRKKKGHIVGLVNLGSTCFLNTLLQALASCALFIQWLTQQKHEENSLTSSLLEVLWVLNGNGNGDVHAPVEVLSALKRHGWMVPAGGQDAHELFHVILSTLQEENKKIAKAGSLSDALPALDTPSQSSDILDDSLDPQCEENVENKTAFSEPHIFHVVKSKKEKETSKIGEGDILDSGTVPGESSCGDCSLICSEVEKTQDDSLTASSTEIFYSFSQESEKEVKQYCGDVEESTWKVQFDASDIKENNLKRKSPMREIVQKCKGSQESLRDKPLNIHGYFDRGTGVSLSLPQSDAPPFQGLLTSTLQCSVCGYYSSLHYDTFDSLSLPLGDNFHLQGLKLQDLLRKFVKTEDIPEVDCEKCCKKTTALKTMNFAKLPPCLCLHMVRTTWQTYSHTPSKRGDHVDFPEYLPMDEYTVSARLKKAGPLTTLHALNSETTTITAHKASKHMYRLKSVVVHLGSVSSGHFLTYRRGALNSLQRHRIGKLAGTCKDSRRWYLTSDDNVKLSSLCEAMESLAYMLFYERCASDILSVDDEPHK